MCSLTTEQKTNFLSRGLILALFGAILPCACSGGSVSGPEEKPPACVPTAEFCDGQDNDCDEIVDNGFDNLGQNCSDGEGECLAQGVFVCSADGAKTECGAQSKTSSQEICDSKDNDCDGVVDNGFDLQSNSENCGECGKVCEFEKAQVFCLEGECAIGSCLTGFWDLDQESETGCEYGCEITTGGIEQCDGMDNDCDGETDEGPEALASCDDGIDCTQDSCDETIKQCNHQPLDAVCFDSDVCNGIETCDVALGCHSGTPLACDDSLFCNGQETCNTAVGCLAGTPPTLTDGLDCTGDNCDENNDVITHTPNDAFCDDGQWCNGAETCDAILGCQASTPPTLTDGIACTVDSCDEENDAIVHSSNNTACDDGQWCNGLESCDQIQGCQVGTSPVLIDNIDCTVDICDEISDLVVHTANNALCDDNLWCNGAETCDAAKGCQPGTPSILSDNISCTVDNCDETNDKIVHTSNNTACDDNLWCNGFEVCDATEGCQAGISPALTDSVACTIDSCDEESDAIIHTQNNALCDDGLWCNGNETCDPIKDCKSETSPNCSTFSDQCNIGICDENLDQCKKQSKNEDKTCDDETNCTSVTTCQNGSCVGDADKDTDNDAYIDQVCGGDDCEDSIPNINPSILDLVGGKCLNIDWLFPGLAIDTKVYIQLTAAIVIDSNDNSHVAYATNPPGLWKLKYATDAQGWTLETIEEADVYYSDVAIATDSLNNVHIVYTKTGILYYTTNSSGTWLTEQIGSGNYAEIAIDDLDKVHISTGTDSAIQYITNGGGNWSTTTFNSLGITYEPSITIDLNGKIHIIATTYSNPNYQISYITNASGSWEIIPSLYDQQNYYFGNLAVSDIVSDSNNKLHICYVVNGKKGNCTGSCLLRYLTNENGSWEGKYIATDSVSSPCSIIVDQNQKVHITYARTTYSAFGYVTNASGSWENAYLSGGVYEKAQLVTGQSIVINSSGELTVLYRKITDLYGLYGQPAILKKMCQKYSSSADENCDGIDGMDVDGDAYTSITSGGDDCDDTNPNIYPGNGCP